MTIRQVVDRQYHSLMKEHYDVAVFASGYEERCTFVPRQFEKSAISSAVVLGFRELIDADSRKLHDIYYKEHWKSEPHITSSGDDFAIQQLLSDISSKSVSPRRILVDCSSMSRLWYAGLLNWARYGNGGEDTEIDFVYALGHYEQTEGIQAIIEDMLSIPGCEGGPLRSQRSIAIFGLGFNGWATLSVLERLEADDVFAYLASPGAADDYAERVREINRDFLAEPRVKKPILELPLRSVETCYRFLCEIVSPHRVKDSITLVPMGPKPHVLASILVAMRFPEVSCMRVSVTRERPEKVRPTGDIVATTVSVRRQDRTPGGGARC